MVKMNKKVTIFAIAKANCDLIQKIIKRELVKKYAYRNVNKRSATRKRYDYICII